jgi:riboflavin synthase
MFTGLVQALGTIRGVDVAGAGKQISVNAAPMSADLAIGESVAINGACLTVIEHDAEMCSFQAGPETLRRTNLGELRPGDRVNLERALRLSDRLGGHLMQGHVDGMGRIAERLRQGDWELVWFECAADLTTQMVPKGSVAIDGISLTLVDVAAGRFSVALIPHTLAVTTLGWKQPGATVNLETDLLAKYVWRCLRGGGVTLEMLVNSGFLTKGDA